MNVDIEIYLSQLFKFFNDNPKDLLSLVPENKKQLFFERCREVCIQNSEKGEEIPITRKQLIEICVELNNVKDTVEFSHENYFAKGIFQKAPIGFFSLN